MMFTDRLDAGKQLAKKLLKFKNENIVVLAIPRGGLPIGAIISKALKAPLDVALTKKIGHPYHKEFAIGAVSLEDIVLTDDKGIAQDYLDKEINRIRKKLGERKGEYYKHRTPVNLKDKTVIIVDDGIATGNTLLATVALVTKQDPNIIVVAIPVAPESSIAKFKNHPNVNEIICLLVPYNFKAVGQFYERFEQVSDQDAIALLEKNYNHASND